MKPPRKTPEIQTSTFLHQTSNYLPCILHFLPQHCAENHLYILDEGVVTVIVAVQAHFIRINHVVIIPHRQFLIRILPICSCGRHLPTDISLLTSANISSSSLYFNVAGPVITLTLPRSSTNDSSFVGCRCISTFVPCSTAFKKRWHLSSSD